MERHKRMEQGPVFPRGNKHHQRTPDEVQSGKLQ